MQHVTEENTGVVKLLEEVDEFVRETNAFMANNAIPKKEPAKPAIPIFGIALLATAGYFFLFRKPKKKPQND